MQVMSEEQYTHTSTTTKLCINASFSVQNVVSKGKCFLETALNFFCRGDFVSVNFVVQLILQRNRHVLFEKIRYFLPISAMTVTNREKVAERQLQHVRMRYECVLVLLVGVVDR